ncbi:MAG: phosphoglyceromutase, partial [Acidobacteria bacterium]
MVVSVLVGVAAFSLVQPAAPAGRRTENVVLVTLDGVRTQEIFGGL